LGILLFFLLTGCVISAQAAETSLNPSIEIRGEYDDNIGFSGTERKGDFLIHIRPALSLDYRNERWSVTGHGAATIIRHQEEIGNDSEQQDYGLRCLYDASERVRLEGHLEFLTDEALESELHETGLLTVRTRRRRLGGGAGLGLKISERTDLGLHLEGGKTLYRDPGLTGYDTYSFFMVVNRSFLNQRGGLTVKTGYSGYRSRASKMDDYGLYFGLSRSLTETWRLNCSLGLRRSMIDYQRLRIDSAGDALASPFRIVTERDSTWWGMADFFLTKKGSTYSAAMGFNREQGYSSRGEPIEQNRFYVNGMRRLSPRFTINLSGTVYRTRSKGGFSEVNARHLGLGASMEYRFSRRRSLMAGYDYDRHREETLSNGQVRERNRVWISLICSF